MKKRLLATVLALCMVLGMLPGTVWAADEEVSEEISAYDTNAMEDTIPVGKLLSNHGDLFYGSLKYQTNGGKVKITECDRNVTGVVVIPEQIDGFLVTDIGYASFYYCKNLTGITIPDSVTFIGGKAFGNCSELKSIIIPNSVVTIGANAFAGCSRDLTSAGPIGGGYGYEFGWTTTIPGNAFAGCWGLTSVTFPDGITSIGANAFAHCYSLTNITIPNSVTWIGAEAFEHCSNLTNITIPVGVTMIEDAAFNCCTGLTSITIPDSVTSIGNGAFSACTGLTDIDIPDHVTWIGNSAFNSCSSLTSITIPNSITSIGMSAFAACSSLKNVYYGGTEAQWKAIEIDDYRNESLLNATIHYNSTGPDDPAPTDRDITITAMDFGDLTINSSGTATAYFRVTDENGNALSGKTLQYELTGQSGATTVTTDKNGIFGVTTPHLTHSASFWAEILPVESNTTVHNKDQFFDVNVKQLSYSQEWEGVYNGGVSLGVEAGVGVEAGPVELKAVLAGISGSIDLSKSVSIEDKYDDGNRTLTLNCTNKGGDSLHLKSGLSSKLNVLKAELGPGIGISGKASLAQAAEAGLVIENYDPHNNKHLRQIGLFSVVPLTYTSSLLWNRLFEKVSGDICNTEASGIDLSLKGSADTSGVDLTIGAIKGNVNTSGEYASVWNWKDSYDYTNNPSYTTSKSFTISAGGGIGSSLGVSGTIDGVEISAEGAIGDYAYGLNLSNSKEISAKRPMNAAKFDSVSYKIYDGEEKNYLSGSMAEDVYATVTYEGEYANRILESDPDMAKWVSGKNPFINIQNTIDKMFQSSGTASVKAFRKYKEAKDFTFPIGVSLGVNIGGSFGISGEHSFSWEHADGALYNSTVYTTSESDVVRSQIEPALGSLDDLLLEATRAAFRDIAQNMLTKSGLVSHGVSSDAAKITGDKQPWFVVISTVGMNSMGGRSASQDESYAAITLLSEDDLSAFTTMGNPYEVAIYRDESGTTVVTDEELAANPLTLTLQYTDEMLQSAFADKDTTVMLLRYDPQYDGYVFVENAVQDTENMTVTAKIEKSGEYILAVNSISEPGTNILGDLNGDGKVTMADVIRLARGAAGYATLTEQEQKAGDVNRDGKITMADVIRVARYAAGYSPAV